jgi:hypothetical protein
MDSARAAVAVDDGWAENADAVTVNDDFVINHHMIEYPIHRPPGSATVKPSLSGTPTTGSVITVSAGTWENVTAEPPTYAWLVDGAYTTGSESTITVLAEWEGKTLTAEVGRMGTDGHPVKVTTAGLLIPVPAP